MRVNVPHFRLEEKLGGFHPLAMLASRDRFFRSAWEPFNEKDCFSSNFS